METAPEGTPSYMDKAQQTGAKLLVARALPQQVGVDKGPLLYPESVGSGHIPQRDGSIRFVFEMTDGLAIAEGTTYTIEMWASLVEVGAAGETLEDTRHKATWQVEISPQPIAPTKEEKPVVENTEATPAITAGDAPRVIVPAAYTKEGTLPIYKATERDFGANIQPALFNQSGIAKQEEYRVVFKDEAVLDWAKEALFYNEYSGTYNAAEGTEGAKEDIIPKPALSNYIADLAAAALFGGPGTEPMATLEKTELTGITLEKAQQTLETLLTALHVDGYVLDKALDMDAARIKQLGRLEEEAIAAGKLRTNRYRYDYNNIPEEEEGYYIRYKKASMQSDKGSSADYLVTAYVNPRGVVSLTIRDMLVQGDILRTPDQLVTKESILQTLPQEIAASRFPAKVKSITSISLQYAAARADNRQEGMVFTPAWLVLYKDEKATTAGYDCWAEFDAVDGKLLSAIFK